ncbi:MAG: hypothetical protein AB7V46_21045, partial [Thermomicrobiales bacterium]
MVNTVWVLLCPLELRLVPVASAPSNYEGNSVEGGPERWEEAMGSERVSERSRRRQRRKRDGSGR